jgi:pyruvate/2-oxoglutarate dehydrogenase complex dihydrolipoamide dehydrogenase (E3) component
MFRNIFAVGDCNGNYPVLPCCDASGNDRPDEYYASLAIQKGFQESMLCPLDRFYRTTGVGSVGMREADLIAAGIKYEVIEARHADYGAAIAEQVTTGSVRVLASKLGKIYGASVIGEGSAEMINEWALAIQKKIRLVDIMLLQHSFPSMSFMNKTIGEMWMMGMLKNEQ